MKPMNFYGSVKPPIPLNPQQADAIRRVLDRIPDMFTDAPPLVSEVVGQTGLKVKRITRQSGYCAVWIPIFRQYDLPMLKVGVHPRYREAYRQAHSECYPNKVPEIHGPYLVDLTHQICTCPAFRRAGYCKHELGVAHALTREHTVAPSGLIIWRTNVDSLSASQNRVA